MTDNMNVKKANTLLLGASFLWGSGFVGCQFALDAGITPFQLICARMFIASICLCIFFNKALKSITKDEIKAGCAIGICLFLGFSFQTYGLNLTTPSVSAFVTAVYVIFIPFIKRLVNNEKQDIYSNIGAVLTFIGIGFISLTGYSVNMSWGIVLTLICAVFYAFQVIFTDKHTKTYDPINLTIIMTVLNFLLSFVASAVLATVNHDLPSFSMKGALSLLYLGFACTFFAYLFQNVAQKYTSAVRAAIIMSLEAVFGALLSVALYGEKMTMQMLLGCTIVFTAIIISETKLEFMKTLTHRKANVQNS